MTKDEIAKALEKEFWEDFIFPTLDDPLTDVSIANRLIKFFQKHLEYKIPHSMYKERDLKIQNDRLQKEIDNSEREREDRIYNREWIKDRDR